MSKPLSRSQALSLTVLLAAALLGTAACEPITAPEQGNLLTGTTIVPVPVDTSHGVEATEAEQAGGSQGKLPEKQ